MQIHESTQFVHVYTVFTLVLTNRCSVDATEPSIPSSVLASVFCAAPELDASVDSKLPYRAHRLHVVGSCSFGAVCKGASMYVWIVSALHSQGGSLA